MVINRCDFCSYVTDIKCNMERHIYAKHFVKKQSIENVNKNEENVIPNEENVIPNEENVIPNEENVIPVFVCKKCNKIYKTKKYLNIHEIKCKGIDELTCPKCMTSFTNRHNKARHIKRNSCKAMSIILAREPKTQTVINNSQTINNNIQNNNFIINNFGNERIDHISHEEIVNMLLSGINTIPMFIEKKHFNKNFPENNNILYTKENKCKVLENDMWKEKDISILSSKLIKDNSQVLLLYCDQNEIKITEQMMDEDMYERIKNKLVIIYNKTDNEKYNEIIGLIKDLVKNSKQ